MIWDGLIPAFRSGQPLALSRLISKVEIPGLEKTQIMKTVFPWCGKAHIIGLTGPPGAGKSSITFRLAELIVDKGLTVGIICIDPTSPFSGGAFLGDRIRMSGLNNRPEVFVRSLATRGSLGGLSTAAKDVVQLMDAAGKDVILIETVGMGQVGEDIKKVADATVLVTVPGLGDGIQALKAGIMEIADIFVVNKADRDGADETVTDLEQMLQEVEPCGWKPKVLKTSAARNLGIQELWHVLVDHRQRLEESGEWLKQRRQRTHNILLENIREHVVERLEQELNTNEFLLLVRHVVDEGSLDPYTTALYIAEYFFKNNCNQQKGGKTDD